MKLLSNNEIAVENNESFRNCCNMEEGSEQEEQRKKLHDHWLQLATNDLPAAYETWKDFHQQRWHMMSCLEQELTEKLVSRMQDGEEKAQEMMVESPENNEEMEEENEGSLQSQQSNQSKENAPSSEEDEELVPGENENVEAMNHRDDSIPCYVQNMEVTVSMDSSNWDADNKFVPTSTPNQVPSLRATNNFNHLIKVGNSTAHQDMSAAFSGDLTNNGHHLMDIHQAVLVACKEF